jgi:Cu(I)/Ag(I) efflux system membrane protein CusA/SilA
MSEPVGRGPLAATIRFCLENKLVVVLLLVAVACWGVWVAPFDWDLGDLSRDPVPVDAIPDYGENQQIVFTEWSGRSPRDVEDQLTYPLTVSLLGIAGVKTVRSFSYFGFSTVYIIFEEDVEFERSRIRVLEKLASLPPSTFPPGVQPALGPDATPLGQIYQYTLEGRDESGNPAGGWDLEELRAIQDWQVRFSLMTVKGVSEVASVGGFVREYQIDVDPDAMRAHGVTLEQVFQAVRMSNVDVGARTIEVNRVEYVIRGLGFIKSVSDIEETVISVSENVPIRIRDIAHVSEGPALRRGALDKEGAEAVGGIVVVRYGENPLVTIQRLKEKILEISAGLPKKTLADGRISQVTVVPFYDRSGLIRETLATLSDALFEEILVTIIVVLLMLMHLRSAVLVAGVLPLVVLVCFIAMKSTGVDANVVALSGIAIAIGTIVDMGVILCENILRHIEMAPTEENRREVIYRATMEVAGAIFTAVLTTIISFLPVFTMEAAEGKLFKPLAYTKSFALIASVVVALIMIPPFAHLLYSGRLRHRTLRLGVSLAVAVLGGWIALRFAPLVGVAVCCFGIWQLVSDSVPESLRKWGPRVGCIALVVVVLTVLTEHWLPLGVGNGFFVNLVVVTTGLCGVFAIIAALQWFYEPILRWCLRHKLAFLTLPTLLVLFGVTIWLGGQRVFGFLPRALTFVGIEEDSVRTAEPWRFFTELFPGLGTEFMPNLSEGAFLYMPTTMPHGSIGESMDSLRKQDMAIRAIPEVDLVVGKIGRAESPLDPAPISMVETVISYKPEYVQDDSGLRKRFRTEDGLFARDEFGELIEDPHGSPFRQWRDHIETDADIWREIERAAKMPGSTSAPKLQPIETRLVMLQTGMRAPMGVKVFGPDLESIEQAGLRVEALLREVPSIRAGTVNADRVIGKPYLEIEIDRSAIARYGISVRHVQDVIEVAIGGKELTTTVEGRERYPVRVRYLRELRDSFESLERILVSTPAGAHIPLSQIATILHKRGPMVIKGEDTKLVAYVTFDGVEGVAEATLVDTARTHLEAAEKEGRFVRPPGVSYRFAGNYENQVRSTQRLSIVLPAALLIIFLILHLQFRSVATTLIVFSGVFVAWSGGFQMLWLYGQEWFLDVSLFGENLRDVFQVRPYNLSVAVWVGFLALFGIATDDGVINGTYLRQIFMQRKPATRDEIREAVVAAGKRRIRPCLMTVGTTILALIPVLTSTGRGADVMVPMAIPSFGGMTVALITVFIVPTLYCLKEEVKLQWKKHEGE